MKNFSNNNSIFEETPKSFNSQQDFTGSSLKTFFSFEDAKAFMLTNGFFESQSFEFSFTPFNKEQFFNFAGFLKEIFPNFKTGSSIIINVNFTNTENTNFSEFTKSAFFQENIEAFDKFGEEFQNFIFSTFQEKDFGISIIPTLANKFGNFTFFDEEVTVDFSFGAFTSEFLFSVRCASSTR